jgi:predicted dienelactone hydrolase
MFCRNGSILGKLLLATAALSSVISAQFGIGGIPLPAADPPIPTANKTGAYSVGVRKSSYISQGRNLTLYWWYPAYATCNTTPFVSAGGISGQAMQNAPLNRSDGPHPLIIFSSGLGAYSDGYYFYTQNLASHGYIVVSLSHYVP